MTGPSVRSALAAARRLDQPAFISLVDEASTRWATRTPTTGPLSGMPFAVKDNIDVAGLPTTAACPMLDSPAPVDAIAVQRLVESGALPIGKTNMDQFATGLVGTRSPFGACHSVASVEHVSGGSSSGSAVAVATGVVPFALGTDTAGSGRVPAAFNGIVGIKPTRGLVSTRGVLPAAPSLDCVTVLAGDLGLARTVTGVIAGYDAEDPWSRRPPTSSTPGVAQHMGVLGVPSGPIDLSPLHEQAWLEAKEHIGSVVRLVPVDLTPMLAVARLLYESALLAERLAAFGHWLEPNGPHLDPVVRAIVLGGRGLLAADVFQAQHRLAGLARDVERALAGVDAVLLPTTPCHPTLAEVAADPVGVNARLGTYTNMVNLLDMCAVALPVGTRRDGLPFGVQLIAPAFADEPLLDLAARLCGERPTGDVTAEPGHTLVAVCGAHLSGEPLNPVLTSMGAVLHRRARTAPGYRMVRIEGRLPRPGLIDDGGGPRHGIEVELWQLPDAAARTLADGVAAPLRIGTVRLDDGSRVAGYVVDGPVGDAPDISASGGWRAHLREAGTLAGDRARG